MSLRLGVKTPIVVQYPGGASPWEATATVDDLTEIARAADGLGFHHLTCSEHIGVPVQTAVERGATYWDPVATLAFLAGQTKRIRLATSIVVLGYHHPLALAKRYGTVDLLSGGRVVLGVGVGSLREEFELLSAEWSERGSVADDALAALRAALGAKQPSYDGSHYNFNGFVVEPTAVQARVPLWVGGRTVRSLHRAVALADGWTPFGLSAEQLEGLLSRVAVPKGFELVLSPARALDPLGDPAGSSESLRSLRKVGATVVEVGLRAESAGHYTDQLAALAKIADDIR
jgi:probable F420-dependent oxidoreductase